MNEVSLEIVDSIKRKIIARSERTPFMQTRLGVFLSTDWIEYFIDKMAYKMYLRSLEGEKSADSDEMETLYVAHESSYIEDSESINIEPQIIERDKDGNIYYTYPNNIVEKHKPKYHLVSIFPSEEVQNEVIDYLNYLDELEIERRKKKVFASYLNLSEEEIVLMSWDEIDEAIYNKYIKTHRWKRRALGSDKLC